MPATNNRHPQCDEVLPLIPAYAIGAADADESALVEAALPHCPDAQAELAAFHALADELRAGVPQIEPPAALKTRLIAVTARPQELSQTPLKVTPRLHPAWLALAAAVVLLVVSNVYWLTRPTQPALLLTQDITWTRLENNNDGNAWALMMWNPQGEGAVLCAYNFPELEPGQTYQLWLRNEQGGISGGTFTVNERGFGLLRVRAGQAIDGFEIAGVTTEPDGGSSEPTGHSVVLGEV